MLLVIFYYYYPNKAWGTLTETEFPLAVMPVSKKVWCKYSKHTEGRSEEGLYHHSHQGTEAQITSHRVTSQPGAEPTPVNPARYLTTLLLYMLS